jgi:EpsD family peptidyl-prolyl cis-trans isomerase
LQRQTRLTTGQGEAAARVVLDTLIEQELAAQGARASGVDKDPAVLQALEAARREVLARAYQDRLAAGVTERSSDEIDAFYNAHPALFAQRKIYMLQEFNVEAGSPDLAKLRMLVGEARSAKEMDAKLIAANLRYSGQIYARAAEDLPLPVVDKLAALGVGEPLLIEQPTGARIYYVLYSQGVPVDRRAASPVIGEFLFTDARRSEVQAKMKSLRAAAKIEYFGAFGAAAAPVAPASAAAASSTP